MTEAIFLIAFSLAAVRIAVRETDSASCLICAVILPMDVPVLFSDTAIFDTSPLNRAACVLA